MKTARYFDEQVLRKRPYIEPAWCAEVIAAPLRRFERPEAASGGGERLLSPARVRHVFFGS